MPLTALEVANAKHSGTSDKPERLHDEEGLYLELAPAGGRWWRLKYRIGGKEKRISLGVYPKVSLKDARAARDEARTLIARGIDPSAERKALKASAGKLASRSFEAIAREWHATHSSKWTERHATKIMRRLEQHVFPVIGSSDIASIEPTHIFPILLQFKERGNLHSGHRAHQDISQIFRHAVISGRAPRDPSADLRGFIPAAKEKNHASIRDMKEIGGLLRAMDDYTGSLITRCALRLAPLVFVRPGELRHAEWAEFNFDANEWRIPAAKMKMRDPHIVPLSKQAIAIIEELRPLTCNGRYLFPGERTRDRPMSENTINAALRRLGYSKEEMTGHGFRSMASTLLNEYGWGVDAIERQLAHAERNKVRAAYNHAQYLPERRRMMQWWADALDMIRNGKEAEIRHTTRRKA